MSTQTDNSLSRYGPTEAAIRDKARELYIRSGWISGRDLENWLEAEAFLRAHPSTSLPPRPFMSEVRSHSPYAVDRRSA